MEITKPAQNSPENRSSREVIADHLAKLQEHKIEEDLAGNYAEEVILLTHTGVYRGHAGVRDSYQVLRETLGDARLEYYNLLLENEYVFLEWRVLSDSLRVNEGADSFVVRNGKVVAQTMHYTVKASSSGSSL
jgi:hypothetical protein